jgi:CDP-paratose 2-epimerase
MEANNKLHLLIAGGAGFIGTNVTIEALERGHKVTIFDSFVRKGVEDNAKYLESKYGPEQLRIVRGDIRNFEDLQRVRTVADVIINFAANPGVPWSMSWPQYDFNVNAVGVQNLLEFARFQGKIPFIQASTNKVYSDLVNEIPMVEDEKRYSWKGINDSGKFYDLNIRTYSEPGCHPDERDNLWQIKGISETFPVGSYGKYPHSPYGVSKLAADQMCQEYAMQYGMPIVLNRMSCIYGNFQKGVEDQGWTWWFVYAKKKGLPLNIFGDGKQVRDVLWGGDVARLYVDEAEKLVSGELKFEVFNVGGGMQNNVSLLELIDFLDEEFGGEKIKLEFKDWRPADQKIYISDTSKVGKVMGFKQEVDWKTGIRKIWEEIK